MKRRTVLNRAVSFFLSVLMVLYVLPLASPGAGAETKEFHLYFGFLGNGEKNVSVSVNNIVVPGESFRDINYVPQVDSSNQIEYSSIEYSSCRDYSVHAGDVVTVTYIPGTDSKFVPEKFLVREFISRTNVHKPVDNFPDGFLAGKMTEDGNYSFTFTVPNDKANYYFFATMERCLTVKPSVEQGAGGSITSIAPNYDVTQGTPVTVTVAPQADYKFLDFEFYVQSSGRSMIVPYGKTGENTYTFDMPETSVFVKALFLNKLEHRFVFECVDDAGNPIQDFSAEVHDSSGKKAVGGITNTKYYLPLGNIVVRNYTLQDVVFYDQQKQSTVGTGYYAASSSDSGEFTMPSLDEGNSLLIRLTVKRSMLTFVVTKGSVSLEGSGSLTPSTASSSGDRKTYYQLIPSGSTVTVTADPPAEGERFSEWTITENTGSNQLLDARDIVGLDFTTAKKNRILSFTAPSIYGSRNSMQLEATYVQGFAISFDPNGGSGVIQDIPSQAGSGSPESFTLPACTFTPPAKKQFSHWQVGEDPTEEYAEAAPFTASQNTVVKAVWKDCTHRVGEESKLVQHNAVASTCTQAGSLGYWECSLCGNKYRSSQAKDGELLSDDAIILAPSHQPAQSWSASETHHWHECTACHEKVGEAAHDWNGGEATTAATCNSTGVMTFTCTTCGATKTQVIDEDEAAHTLGENPVPAVAATEDERGHGAYYECTRCKKKFTSTDLSSLITDEKTLWTYYIKLSVAEGGLLAAFVDSTPSTEAKEGDEVTLTVTPDNHYQLSSGPTVTAQESSSSEPITITDPGSSYRFTMPGAAVVIEAAFQAITPVIGTDSLAGGTVNQEYSATISFTGGTLSFTGALPEGMTLDTSTGVLSGTPLAGGSFPLTVTVSNEVAEPAVKEYTLVVAKLSQQAPTTPSPISPTTINGSDGQISGVTDTMEYSSNNGESYTAVASGTTSITGLSVGAYLVRYRETATHTASPAKSVEVTNLPTYAVTVTGGKASGGTVTEPAASGSFLKGEAITVTADAPAPGMEFHHWETSPERLLDDASSAEVTFDMVPQPVTLTAHSVAIVPTLLTKALADAQVGVPFTQQIEVRLGETAPPVDGVTFTYSAENLPAGLSMDPSTGLISGTPTAAADQATVSIQVTTSAGGTATSPALTMAVARGDQAPPPAEGFTAAAPTRENSTDGKISGVTTAMEYCDTEDGSYTPCPANDITGLAPGDWYVRYAQTDNYNASPATTVRVPACPLYDLTVTGGSSEKYKYAQDEPVTVTANTAEVGMTFTSWSGTDGLSLTDSTTAASETIQFTMPAQAVALSANYDYIDYTVTVDSEIQNGTVTASPATAHYQDTVSVTVTPDYGYALDTLTVTTEESTLEANVNEDGVSFIMPAQDVTVSATFKALNLRTVTVPEVDPEKPEPGGKVTVDKNQAYPGESVTITPEIANNYQVDSIKVKTQGGEEVAVTGRDTSYTFIMPDADVTVTATFRRRTSPIYYPPAEPAPPQEDGPARIIRQTEETDSEGNVTLTTEWSDGRTVVATTSPFGDRTVKVSNGSGDTLIDADLPSQVEESKGRFVDVPDYKWYREPIDDLADRGILMGSTPTYFLPKKRLSRGMMLEALYNISGRPAYDQSYVGCFPDIEPTNYFKQAAEWGASLGVTYGTLGGFKGRDPITREQMVVLLYRYAMVLGLPSDSDVDLASYKDGDKVSGYARDAMRWAITHHLIYGRTNGKLDPLINASRYEAAGVLDRFIHEMM